MYQVGLDWTFAKLLETGLTRLAPVMDPEEPECYICKEMDPFLANRVQVMLGYNVFECCRINGNSSGMCIQLQLQGILFCLRGVPQ